MPSTATEQESKGADIDAAVGQYWPAYMLADWKLERAGRVKSSVGNGTGAHTTCDAMYDVM
jgi:hypothetical protein